MDEVYFEGPLVTGFDDMLKVEYSVLYNDRPPGCIMLCVGPSSAFEDHPAYLPVSQKGMMHKGHDLRVLSIEQFFPNGSFARDDCGREGVGSLALESLVYPTALKYDAEVILCSTPRHEMQRFLYHKHGFETLHKEDKIKIGSGSSMCFIKIL